MFYFFPVPHPTLALTGKEKTWDNLLGKPYFEVASESLNTGRAENHAEKNPSLLLHPLFYWCESGHLQPVRGEGLPHPWQPFTRSFRQWEKTYVKHTPVICFSSERLRLVESSSSFVTWEEGLSKDGCVAGSSVLEPQEGQSGKMQL